MQLQLRWVKVVRVPGDDGSVFEACDHLLPARGAGRHWRRPRRWLWRLNPDASRRELGNRQRPFERERTLIRENLVQRCGPAAEHARGDQDRTRRASQLDDDVRVWRQRSLGFEQHASDGEVEHVEIRAILDARAPQPLQIARLDTFMHSTVRIRIHRKVDLVGKTDKSGG